MNKYIAGGDLKMNLTKVLIILLLCGYHTFVQAGKIETDKSIQIVNKIIGVCEKQGILACESNLQGIDIVFDYARLFDQVAKLDKQFKEFLEQRFPDENGFDFDVIQASLNLSLNITFKPEQFTTRITDATKVKDGYDVIMDNGSVIQLRKNENSWAMTFPSDGDIKFEQLKPFYNAGQLKRSIIIYRMLEAEMVNISKDQVEENVSSDLAPILVAVFGKEKVPALMRWVTKDINEVVNFYSRFSSIEDMMNHISKKYGLS